MRDKGLKRECSDYITTVNCSSYQVKSTFTINLYYLCQHFLNAIVFSGLQKKVSRITIMIIMIHIYSQMY